MSKTADAPRDLAQQLAELRAQVNDLVGKQADTSREVTAQKMEAFSRLAGSIARDLNNSLTLVLGNCDFLLERVHPGGPLYSYITEIKNAGEQSVSLTRRLMSFSTHRVFQPVVMNINAIVKTVEKQVANTLGQGIAYSADLTADRCLVKVEPAEMERLLVQFAANAREAMPKGGTFSIATSMAEAAGAEARKLELVPGKYVSIKIADSGAGMDAATLGRVFEPFYSTKQGEAHAGIGLFTAYATVKMCAGAIQCDSVKGKGSVFTILLPLVDQPDSAPPPPRKASVTPAAILVVEDEPHVRSLLRQMLAPQGYRVIEAANGLEALATLEKEKEVDMILTDVVMPEMDGRELGAKAAKLKPGIRILYTSGYTDDMALHSQQLAFKAHFIQKPFTPLQLREKIRQVMGT